MQKMFKKNSTHPLKCLIVDYCNNREMIIPPRKHKFQGCILYKQVNMDNHEGL